MARFPFRPGAGAKAIRNPIYWNRLYLQESQSSSRQRRYSKDAHLTARWLNVNTNLNFFLCGWLKPVLDNEDLLTSKESEYLGDALGEVNDFRDTIASSWAYMSQANFNKYVTRIKRLILFTFKITIKYDLFGKGEARLLDYSYDSKEKDFVLIYADLSTDRRYFMGRPAVHVLDEIRRRYRQSFEMVSEDFREETPVPEKKSSVRKKKKKRHAKPSAASRAKGVVEEVLQPGVIMFRYNDCVNREATVRGRIKLHLKVAVQPYVKEGAYPDFSEKIGKMLSRACRLKDGKSVRIPVVHDGRKLLVFKFER